MFERRAVISLAGPAAQARFRARSLRVYHAAPDYTHVLDMLDWFLWRPDSPMETRAYIRLLETRTTDLVNEWWAQIEALANALIAHKQMTTDEVVSTITGSRPVGCKAH